MRTGRASLFAILAIPAVLAACADRDDTPVSPDAARQAALPEQAQGKARGIHAKFAEIERQVPGFGGYFIDAEGNLSAYVTDPRSEAAARAALQPVQRARPASARGKNGGEIRIHQGKYAYSQLSAWNERLPRVLSTKGVVFTDLDEAANRLRVGVENAGLETAVRTQARQLGIPDAALEVSVAEPFQRHQTLQNVVRPLRGGIQINYGNFLCTLGWVVRDAANTLAYLTNSHCTNIQGGVEGTQHHQPLAPNLIGTEYADPVYFVGGACPAGQRCRYSDSSLGAITPVLGLGHGGVAQTLGWGSITIAALFNTGAEQAFPTQGQVLDKIGRTTGWTWGAVSATCVNVAVFGTNITLLCQDIVNAPSGGGDSGSPVFVYGGPTLANPAGILWGGNNTSFVFSAVGNIEFELGNLIFL